MLLCAVCCVLCAMRCVLCAGCVLRAACCVLRAAYSVLRAACCVLLLCSDLLRSARLGPALLCLALRCSPASLGSALALADRGLSRARALDLTVKLSL